MWDGYEGPLSVGPYEKEFASMWVARIGVLGVISVVVHLALATSGYSAVEKPPPKDTVVQEVTWSDLPWSVRVQLLWPIVKAPKILYRLEKMVVYRDGVWVDYSITNLSSKRKFVTPMFLRFPITHMDAWDSHKRHWRIPQFKGHVQFRDPDTFVSVESFDYVRFGLDHRSGQWVTVVQLWAEFVERGAGRTGPGLPR
jgi:hypothetical protein